MNKHQKTEQYRGAPLPENEAARLQELYSFQILDSDFQESFDRITELASYITGAPMALISLLDPRRQWFKSKVGLEVRETPREYAFCGYTILQDDLFEVQDARADERFAENPLVTDEPGIRFYGGYPLKTSRGYNLGTLCVLDHKPGRLSETEKRAMQTLADQVVLLLEMRRQSLQLQEALREKERQQQVRHRFFHASGDLFAIFSEEGQWLDYNEEWKETKSLPANFPEIASIVSRELIRLSAKLRQNRAGATDSSERERRMVDSVETEFATILCEAEKPKILHWKANLDPEDRLLYLYGREVTREINLLQELNRARLDAHRFARARSLFMYTLSHEIRNPLNALLGSLQMFRDSEPTEKQQEILSIMDSAGQGLLSLINNVLDMGQLESGNRRIVSRPFNLDDALKYVESLLLPATTNKKILLQVTRSGNVPIQLQGDRTALQQVLLNAASNAVKFTKKGHVEIRAELLQERPVREEGSEGPKVAEYIGKERQGHRQKEKLSHASLADRTWVRFLVEDTGPGIDPEDLQNLFLPFDQLGDDTRDVHGGSGLGLAISRSLVESMGGQIRAESKPGQGTLVEIILPFDRAGDEREKPEGKTGHQEEPDWNGKSILVVEDGEISRILMTKFLERTGIETVIVSSGEEALKQVSSRDFDIILLDIHLPDMNGFRVCKHIRAYEEGKGAPAVPILAYSGNSSPEEWQMAKDAGFNGWITKPAFKQEIIEELLKWMKTEKKSN